MKLAMHLTLAIALSTSTTCFASAADDFRLGDGKRIACSRGLSPGKLSTATCRSYAYLVNVHMSEYFRCTVSLAFTRDNKQVISVQTDGGCAKKERPFVEEETYAFDAAETEPTNTNSFFGSGGYVMWASDTSAKKMKAYITIASGLGTDVSRCMDMTFD